MTSLFFADLPEEVQRDFLEYKLTITHVHPGYARLPELFVSLSSGMPLNRPELLRVYAGTPIHDVAYQDLVNAEVFKHLDIANKRFKHAEQVNFILAMTYNRFAACSTKQVKKLYERYADKSKEDFDNLDWVKRARRLFEQMSAVMNEARVMKFNTEKLHTLATVLYFLQLEDSALPRFAIWWEEFCSSWDKAVKESDPAWNQMVTDKAGIFYSMPALERRYKFMHAHYAEHIKKD